MCNGKNLINLTLKNWIFKFDPNFSKLNIKILSFTMSKSDPLIKWVSNFAFKGINLKNLLNLLKSNYKIWSHEKWIIIGFSYEILIFNLFDLKIIKLVNY